jgi:hypothetical protein
VPATDTHRMRTSADRGRPDEPEGEVEFFGFKLTVRNPRLAELLNSSEDEDVRVVDKGGAEAVAPEAAEPAVPRAPVCRGEEVGDVSVVRLRPARDDV